jgi:hypothetical protein
VQNSRISLVKLSVLVKIGLCKCVCISGMLWLLNNWSCASGVSVSTSPPSDNLSLHKAANNASLLVVGDVGDMVPLVPMGGVGLGVGKPSDNRRERGLLALKLIP